MIKKDKTNFPKEINNFKKEHSSQSSNQEKIILNSIKKINFSKDQIPLLELVILFL